MSIGRRLPRGFSRAQGKALDVRLAMWDLPFFSFREIPHTEVRKAIFDGSSPTVLGNREELSFLENGHEVGGSHG